MKRILFTMIFIGVLSFFSAINAPDPTVFAGCNDGSGSPTPVPYPTSGVAPTPDSGIPWEAPVPYPTSNPQTPVPTPFELRLGSTVYASGLKQPCPPENSGGGQPASPTQSGATGNICYPQRGLRVGLTALVTADGTRLRNGASTDNGVITGMSRGTLLIIVGDYRCGSGHTWWQVQYGDLNGWVAEVNLEISVSMVPTEISIGATEVPEPAAACYALSAYTDFYKNKRSLMVYYPDSHPISERVRIYFWNGTLVQWEPVPNSDWGVNFSSPQLYSNGWSYYFIATRWYWIDGSHTQWNVDDFWAVYYCP